MKKNIYTFCLGVVFLMGVGCSSPKISEEAFRTEVSIKEQIKNGAFLVDVRTPEEFSAGSLKGAVNIPLNEVEGRLDEFKGKSSIIVFCRSGNRSSQAISILQSHGINNLINGINKENINDELLK